MVVYTQARNQGGEAPLSPPGKMCWTLFEKFGRVSEIFPPKVVTGLFTPVYKGERRSLPCYNIAILVILLT